MVEGFDLQFDGAIATLILNRPSRKNALTEAMWLGLPGLLAEVLASPAKVLVVRGAGDAFAAGADISEFETVYATTESSAAYFAAVAAAMSALAAFPNPTIAQIDGACIGGGMGLALCCDLRLASDRSRLGITPGKLGLMYSLADTKRLIDAVGPSRAKDILYTGRILGVAEAVAIGLVDAVIPATGLEAAVREKADQIAAASQHSARASKAIISRILAGQAADDAETDRWMVEAVAGPDFQEGRNAFLAKRPPQFPVK